MFRDEAELQHRVAKLLQRAGWRIGATSGARAVAEYRLAAFRVDFALLVDDEPLAVVEVKRAVSDASALAQATRLLEASTDPGRAPAVYVSNGRETIFLPSPGDAPRDVGTFHGPDSLLRLRSGKPKWTVELRDATRALPSALRPHQAEAVRAIEDALGRGERRLLLAVAAGAGRTAIAATFIDRLLRWTTARRVLVLADSRLIGEQFQTMLSEFETTDGHRLGNDFVIRIADRRHVDANVIVTSAAGLEHLATGEHQLRVDHFDLVWTDQPQSLSGSTWQGVLDRFDAPLVGITSSPTPQTFAFFDGNLVAAIDAEQLMLTGYRPAADRALVDMVWDRVAARRGDLPADEALAHALLDDTPALGWRELNALLERFGTATVRRLPNHVIEFVIEYVRGRNAQLVVDPAVSNPALLSAVVEADAAQHAEGTAVGDLNWRFAQSLRADTRLRWSVAGEAADASAGPDLVICAPPLGGRLVDTTLQAPDGREIRLRDHLGDAMVAQAVQRLSADGEALWLVPDTYFRPKTKSVAAALNDLGLYIHAAVALRDSAGEYGVASTLVLLRRSPAEAVFVGELSAEVDVNQLLSNLRRGHRGAVPALGRLVPAVGFKGPDQTARQERLAELLVDTPGELLPLVETLASRPTKPQRDGDFDLEPNSVYMPTFVSSPAYASREEITSKPWAYYQLPFDPDKAVAEYVANILNTEVGRALRESAAGGTVHPSVSRRGLEELRIPLPSVQEQREVVATQARIRALRVELDVLERRLGKEPAAAPAIKSLLDRIGEHDPVDTFREALPFPLASILWRYQADDDIGDKVEHLHRLFEASAVYFATVLLSGFASDGGLFAEHKQRWFKKLRRNSFDRSNFGTWVLFGKLLTSSTRKLLDDESTRPQLLSAFSIGSVGFIDALANQDLWSLLDEASSARNKDKGHGGLLGPQHQAENLARSEVSLARLMEFLGQSLDDVHLVRPITSRRRSGVTLLHVQLLQGANTIFRKMEIATLLNQVLDENDLFLVSATDRPAPALLLVRPFVRLKPSPPSAPNAAYFYSALQDDGNVEFISHHFDGAPSLIEPDPEVRSFIAELQEPPQ